MIDFNALFQPQQPTSYPSNPLAALLRSFAAASLLQSQMKEQEKRRALEEGERQRAKSLQNYNLLNSIVQQYTSAGQQPPQELLAQVSQLQKQLVGVGLQQESPGQNAQPGQMVGGVPWIQGNPMPYNLDPQTNAPFPPQFVVPGMGGQFRTLQEMAQATGMKLKPGVDGNQNPVQLRLRGVDLNQLFIDPQSETNEAKQQALASLRAFMSNYSLQQIRSDPRLGQHFTRLYEAAGRPPEIATEMQRQMQGIQVAAQRPEEGSLGRALAPAGQQTIQVPTGPQMQVPIAPQVQQEMEPLIIVDNSGRVLRREMVPKGSQVRVVTPPTPAQPKSVDVFDANGRFIGRHTLPPGGEARFLSRPPQGGGGGAETQNRMKASLMSRYLAGQTLNERELRVLFGTAGEDIVPARDREILKMWRENIDPITGEHKDPTMAARLKPDVDRIVNQMVTPTAQPTGGLSKSITMAELNEIARTEGKPIASVVAAAKQQGYTITGQVASSPAPRPTVTSDVTNIIRATAAALKRRRVNWTVARLRILKELSSRGVNVGDPNVVRAVDQARY